MKRKRIKAVRALTLLAILLLAVQLFTHFAKSSPYDRLMGAIERGDAEAVKAELDKGTNPNNLPPAIDEPIAPMCAAAQGGNLEIVQLLLDRGADINSGDSWDYNPLEVAATNNRIQVMELLLARGASVNDSGNGGSDSLWRAAVGGNLEAVQCLLAHGANPNTKDGDGQTLLSVVGRPRLRAVATALKKAGAR